MVDIQREDGAIVASPGPDAVVLVGDTITFAGDVQYIKNVLEMGGVSPADNVDLEKQGMGGDRLLAEAVLSSHNPLVGQSVREGRFR